MPHSCFAIFFISRFKLRGKNKPSVKSRQHLKQMGFKIKVTYLRSLLNVSWMWGNFSLNLSLSSFFSSAGFVYPINEVCNAIENVFNFNNDPFATQKSFNKFHAVRNSYHVGRKRKQSAVVSSHVFRVVQQVWRINWSLLQNWWQGVAAKILPLKHCAQTLKCVTNTL